MALAALKPGAVPVEQEVEQTKKDHSWSRQAGIWCQDREFHHWMESLLSCQEGEITEEDAIQWVRLQCGIQSRRELDDDAEAQQRWLRQIAGPYRKWRIARGLE